MEEGLLHRVAGRILHASHDASLAPYPTTAPTVRCAIIVQTEAGFIPYNGIAFLLENYLDL